MLSAATAQAVPEMARFGYFSCTSCHISPSGGGVLTPYGRGLSAERLSTWSYKGEEQLVGIPSLGTPEWLALGGDFRSIQTHVETAQSRDGRWIRMQYDVGAAVILPHVTIAAAGGPRADVRGVPEHAEHKLRFREYYAKFDALDGGLSVRSGRFYPRFGLMMPQHTSNVRAGLGFDQGAENLNAEVTWITESDDVSLTRLFGARPQELEGSREKGWAAAWAHQIFNKHRVGVSALSTDLDGTKRTAYGLNGIFALNDKWFVMSEADRQRHERDGLERNELLVYSRLGFEPVQGVVPFLQVENSAPDLKDLKSRFDSCALGTQWYPRPHFDFEASLGTLLKHTDYTYVAVGYLLIHYYL